MKTTKVLKSENSYISYYAQTVCLYWYAAVSKHA